MEKSTKLLAEKRRFEDEHGKTKKGPVSNWDRNQVLELYFQEEASIQDIAIEVGRTPKSVEEIINRSVVGESEGARDYVPVFRTDRTGRVWTKRDARRFEQWRRIWDGESSIREHPEGYLPSSSHIAKVLARSEDEILDRLESSQQGGFGI